MKPGALKPTDLDLVLAHVHDAVREARELRAALTAALLAMHKAEAEDRVVSLLDPTSDVGARWEGAISAGLDALRVTSEGTFSNRDAALTFLSLRGLT